MRDSKLFPAGLWVALGLLGWVGLSCGNEPSGELPGKAAPAETAARPPESASKQFPPDFPQYPHADVEKFEYSFEIVMTLEALLESTDTPDKVGAFYERELEAKGWTITDSQERSGIWLITAKKRDRSSGVTISREGGKTRIGIQIIW